MSLFAKVAPMPVELKMPSPVSSLSAQFQFLRASSTGKKASSPSSAMISSPSSQEKRQGASGGSPRRKLDFAGMFGASPFLASVASPSVEDGFDPDLQDGLAPIVDAPLGSMQSLFDAPLLTAGEDSNDSILSQLSCSPSHFNKIRRTPSSTSLRPTIISPASSRASPAEFLDPNFMNIQTPRSSCRAKSQRLSLGNRSRLVRTPPGSLRSVSRCSLQFAEVETTPDVLVPSRLKRAQSFAGGKSRRSFGSRKRPASPGTPQQVTVKRRSLSRDERSQDPMETAMDTTNSSTIYSSENQPLRWRRYHSDSETVIKTALNRAEQQSDLIADFSKPYCLPLITGKHSDLKAINSKTMADILEGKYNEVIGQCITVDCRYPYEFAGGHIKGAVNMYTKQQIYEKFFTSPESTLLTSSNSNKRTVIIMHCEFSSERGPKMLRFLRAHDRELNKEAYPKLNFPEVYILENGYKAFFEHTKSELCEPQAYKPMLHEAHEEDLKYFRRKSKSLSSIGGASDRNVKRNLPIRSLSFC